MKTIVFALALAVLPNVYAEKPAEPAKESVSVAQETPPSVTHHSVTIGTSKIAYTAAAGYLTLKKQESKDADKEGLKATAKIFYTAYTREGVDTAKRPLLFAFNGGPGAASVWLHLGALGPRRAEFGPDGTAPAPPYKLVDNEWSWLDQADLVFIDPVSTGYSRPVGEEKAENFHGFENDIRSVAEFIRSYTTRENRWLSPKYLIGESYGTTRAAELSDFLHEHHKLYLNGIILVSTVLNFQTIDFSPGNDLPAALFLPGYTATAWYHKKLGADLQSKSLEEVRRISESFALGDYTLALMRGDALSPEEKERTAKTFAQLTGLPVDEVLQQNFRVPPGRFFGELLKKENLSVGRFDSRITGLRYEPGTEGSEFDPSFEAVKGVFAATINDYLRRELRFESELPYEILANVSPWPFNHAENRYLNVAQSLRQAMCRNTYLRVWVAAGYYDLATPYAASDYTVRQLQLDPAIRGNVRCTYYDAGHMMYTHLPSLKKLKEDFVGFLGSR